MKTIILKNKESNLTWEKRKEVIERIAKRHNALVFEAYSIGGKHIVLQFNEDKDFEEFSKVWI